LPVTYSSRRGSSERTIQTFLDWTRRVNQLAILATAILYAYVLYGLFMGDVGHWRTLSPADQLRIATNVESALFYLNIAIGILLLTLCILYYDEEPLGYTLIGIAVLLYYGVPFLLSSVFGDMVGEWQSSHNRAALSILVQLKTAALMLAVPGGILVLRDLFLRVVEGGSRRREEFTAMQYGGAVKEEERPGRPLIGIMAKCWQLPFCRDAIRKGCPIYHARTRCWRQRVGCMCEENVIRHAMDAVISKELIMFDAPVAQSGLIDMTPVIGENPNPPPAEVNRTEEFPARSAGPPASRRDVRIPHNPNIPMSVKKERCRNCVIYNEHQRLKYQFFAPLVVLAVPVLAFLKAQDLSDLLNRVFAGVDSLMARLALTGGAQNTGALTSMSSVGFANYVLIGCLVVIAATMSLRFLEYVIFKMKI
jgi:hypothetical protein